MIRILSVTVYNANDSEKIYYESFRNKQFEDEAGIQKWIGIIEKQWANVGNPVKAYPIRRKKPIQIVDLYKVLEKTALVMNVPISDVVSGSRKREFVDVRKIACMILADADYMPREIEKQLPFKDRVVYKYCESIENRLALEPGFEEKYKEIKRKVMDMTLNKHSVNNKKYNV